MARPRIFTILIVGVRAQMQKIEYLNNTDKLTIRTDESREPQKESLPEDIRP